MSHFREEYECGHAGSQCRCWALVKSITKLKGICPACDRALDKLIAEAK